jgi:hypothetical protein
MSWVKVCTFVCASIPIFGQDPAMFLMNQASGTSANPAAGSLPMVMKPAGSWNLSFMGQAFIDDTQQSGPRGGDKFYSSSWFMTSAEHSVGPHSAFQADLMLSLDPATITNRSYPLLFQTGETAYGRPLVDAQHPHNFIMSLGFHYAHAFGYTLWDVYFAPVGDPALGPVAFPHRASAMELPEATISHHLQDSTHVADEVITTGVSRGKFRLEASGFYGTEPGENRWTIATGPINSWSARIWYFPTRHWAAQVSTGRLAHPEVLEPGDQVRTTASLQYSRPIPHGSWASSLIWGRTHNTYTQRNLNSYLVESVLPAGRKNFLTGRIELADKDELFPQLDDGPTYRIGAYTIGYTRDIALWRSIQTGIGANFTAYSLPDPAKPFYGNHPAGGNIFLRFRIRPAG